MTEQPEPRVRVDESPEAARLADLQAVQVPDHCGYGDRCRGTACHQIRKIKDWCSYCRMRRAFYDALDLVDRLKAENERLASELADAEVTLDIMAKELHQAKAAWSEAEADLRNLERNGP